MKLRQETALTFDDVLLMPQRSSIRSRHAVDTSTQFTRHIRLGVPVVSSNMDTVTESAMAIAMARTGGIGVLHRFMTIERQADEVSRVKRAEGYVVEHPYTLQDTATVRQAKEALIEHAIGGLLIVDAAGTLVGLVSTRDLIFEALDDLAVTNVMTPREKLVTVQEGTSLEDARAVLRMHRLEKLPVLDAQGGLSGLITAQDIVKLELWPNATKDERGRLRVAAALGTKREDIERAAACVNAGVDALVIDIAHGHSDSVIEMTRALKQYFPKVDVVAGNVASAAGVRDLAEAGADAVKVGVGAGSICITRIVTGFGVAADGGRRVCAGWAASGCADHRRRRHPHERRYYEGAGSWCEHGDARQPAGRHGRGTGRKRGAQRPPLSRSAWHGVADGEHRSARSGSEA